MEQNISWIGTAEAAGQLGVTPRRVAGLCSEGKIAGAFRNGRQWKIPAESLQQFMTRSGKQPLEGNDDHGALPVAIGNTSYIDVSSECYYVDKTLLIRDLIDQHSMVTLFTRPRRFGKTLAINMLKTFFEKTQEDTSRYFTDKKIWACGEKYRALQGAYPVIMLTFKDVKYDSWRDTREAIRLVMKDEYQRHPELTESTRLDQDSKDSIFRMADGDMTDVELSRSLMNLTRQYFKGFLHALLVDPFIFTMSLESLIYRLS